MQNQLFTFIINDHGGAFKEVYLSEVNVLSRVLNDTKLR